jgi:hypothetical protein
MHTTQMTVQQHIIRVIVCLCKAGSPAVNQEYDLEDASADPAERIKQQRRQLHKRLGLDGQMKTLLDTEDLVKDEDLVSRGGGGGRPVQQRGTQQAAELLGDMTGILIVCGMRCLTPQSEAAANRPNVAPAVLDVRAGASAREKARIKRLAKKRPAEGVGGKGSTKRQQVAQDGKAAPADKVQRFSRWTFLRR